MVECQTKKLDTILARAQFSGAARNFSPRVKYQCRLSYSVRTAPVCIQMPQHLCARLVALFGHAKILHALVAVGSMGFSLAAAVAISR